MSNATNGLQPSLETPYWPYPVTSDPFIFAIIFETFLYGIYMALFFSCVVILAQKSHIAWMVMLLVITLFSIASADFGYTVDFLFKKLLSLKADYNDFKPKFVFYVVNSTIADMLLLHRCYLIWGKQKWVIVGPAVLFVITFACSLTFETINLSLARYRGFNVILTLVLNLLINILTAGRILYLYRSAKSLLGTEASKQYRLIAKVIIQSGVIFTLYLIPVIAFQSPVACLILDVGLVQVVGIMPTMIVVNLYIQNRPYCEMPQLGQPVLQQGFLPPAHNNSDADNTPVILETTMGSMQFAEPATPEAP